MQFREVLTDTNAEIWQSEARVDSGSSNVKLAGSADWAISKRTLVGGRSAGVDVVELNNGCLKLSVLPTRGMGLWYGEFGDKRLGWQSPVQRPVNPMFVDLNDRNALGWLDGFNEMLCRCGLGWNGPPGEDPGAGNRMLTLHGRIANLPAHFVELTVDDADDSLSVTGHVDETMMFDAQLRLESTVILKAGDAGFTIRDTVRNLGGGPAEMQLLYHTNIGPPFLTPAGQVAVSYSEMAPRDARAAEDASSWQTYGSPSAGYAEQVYYFKPTAANDGRAAAVLHDAEKQCGISVHFDPAVLPCFAVWKNTQLEKDGYVTGLEPATNFPNFRAYEREQARVVSLDPGAAWSTELEFRLYDSAESIDSVLSGISSDDAIVHDQPTAGFSPVD